MATKKTPTSKKRPATSTTSAKKKSPTKTPTTTEAKKSVRRPTAPKVTRRAATTAASISEQVAVAAYYRAERRGFAPGHELDDWLAAEATIQTGQR